MKKGSIIMKNEDIELLELLRSRINETTAKIEVSSLKRLSEKATGVMLALIKSAEKKQ